jgi:Vitamin K-dependent gamma-carboxylase
MRGAAAAWDEFFHAPSGGQRIAAVRIALGSFLLVYFGAMAPDIALLFSDQGVYVPYLLPDFAPPPAGAFALYAAMLTATCALLLGYRTALAAPLLLALFLHHYFLQLAVKQSTFDRLIAITLGVLCLADSGRCFGLDAARPARVAPTRWAERVVAIQCVLLYFGAGFWKLFNSGWHSGALLHANLQGMWATPLGFALVRLDLPQAFWAAASWSIIAFELLLGPLLIVRRTRRLAFALGAGFHLANCFVLMIPEFLVCLAAYPVFMREATLQRAFDATARTTARFSRWPRRASAA